MFGIESQQLKPIHDAAKQFDQNYNPEKLGMWGILFLCCGALAVRNDLWRDRVRNSDIFVCSSDLDNIIQGSDVCTSDDYAIRFSEFIKKWCNDSHAIAVANQRMEKFRNKFSEQNFINHKIYITLAYALNSFQDMGKKELLGFDCHTWISMSSSEQRTYGWPELFFAAGIILNNETSVEWPKMASAINTMGKSGHVDIASLYEHYAGANPFTKKEHKKIRVDQLKKGTRVKLRSGWEAIVEKHCDGLTLIGKVFGDFTETGSIYAHDVMAAYIDGTWEEIELTEEQKQSCELARFFNQRD